MIKEELYALKLFNEKAKELSNSRYVKFILKEKKISFEVKSIGIKRIMPDEDAVKAAVLTLRFFIQDNEKCSFRNMEKVYSSLPISEELKRKYFDIRKKLNEYLDAHTNVKFQGEDLRRRY